MFDFYPGMPHISYISHLGIVELEGIICGEGYQEAPGKVVWEGIAVVVQKQGVVAQWRHGHAHLGQVVKVLHCGHLDVTEQSVRHGL